MLKAVISKSLDGLLVDLASQDPVLRLEARRRFVTMGRPVVGRLRPLLKSGSEQARWEAAKTLGDIGGPDAAQALAGALSDPARDIRWVATEGLIAAGEEALEPMLHELITRSGLVWVREAGIRVLDASLHDRGFQYLRPVMRALKDRAPIFGVPIAAYEALVTLQRSRLRLDSHHAAGA
jgi:HEAT repeat protein